MIEINKYRKALQSLPSEILEAEFNIEKNTSQMIKVSGKEITDNAYSDIVEIFARATGAKTGFAYTQDLEEAPVEIIKRAYHNSKEIDEFNKNRLNKKGQLFIAPENIPAQGDMYQYAISLEALLLNSHATIEAVIVEARIDNTSSRVLNSHGLDKSYEREVHYLSAHILAKKDGKAYNVGFALSSKSFSDINLEEISRQIVNQLESQFDPVGFESGKYPCLLDRTVMVNILMTAWQIFSGIKYQEGSSAISGKLGHTIGSSCLNLLDVPEHKLTGYSFKFDCEGTEADQNKILHKGVLTTLLNNLKSADSLKQSPSGNAGRYALLSGTIPTDIIVTPRILYIEPGESNLDQLLKILDHGVYITESYDVFHSINIASGGFSIPCRGTVIRDGKKTENITELTISGSLTDLLNNIVATGSDLYIEEFLKKSYCIGSPSTLIKELQINAG